MHARVTRIIAFPKVGNIYTEHLYREIEKRHVTVIEGIWSCPWLMRHVKRRDLVHIHWPSFLYFEATSPVRTAFRLFKMLLNMMLLKLIGATVLWTAHNLYPHEGGGELRSHRLGRRILLAFAQRIVVHGPSAASIVRAEFGVAPPKLLVGLHPHWIDSYANVLTRSDCRARLRIRPEEFLYLHIGRCRPYKGLEALIEAFHGIPQPARLLIAGKFSSPDYLEEVRSLARLTPHVDLVPHNIPDDELQVYLNASDCVVLPYRAILTSGTAVLALSFGKPVIAPNLGSLRDHVDSRSGLLYDPNDPLGLEQALRTVRVTSFDPHAAQSQARRFNWSQMADLILDLGAAD